MFISSVGRAQHHLLLLLWESQACVPVPGLYYVWFLSASCASPLTGSEGYKIFPYLVETGSNPFYVMILTSMSECKRHATAYY
jgi:hypothetical protein